MDASDISQRSGQDLDQRDPDVCMTRIDPTPPAEVDGAGAFTAATGRELDSQDIQRNYRRYQYDLISPYCGPEMLEIGAGLGDLSSQFTDRRRLVVTDLDPQAVDAMTRRFSDCPAVEARQLDISSLTPSSAERLAERQGQVDSVLAVNVLEHIENDVDALRSVSRLVRPGGTVIQWVPGYMRLYGDFDRSIGHVRRYTPASLARAGRSAGLTVRDCRPVNLLGGIAWWAAVRKGGTGSAKPGLVKLYNSVVVPITRFLDHFPIPFGQTVLGVFEKP